ncbi:MAG: hypothetical protein NTW86_29895 [Candidatus Sumerlaeota bacterium]|nr:hypothetical protein [Candidatus Sumerlaeota bacterium]
MGRSEQIPAEPRLGGGQAASLNPSDRSRQTAIGAAIQAMMAGGAEAVNLAEERKAESKAQ